MTSYLTSYIINQYCFYRQAKSSTRGVASLAFGYLWGHASDLWGHKPILQWVLTGAATSAFLLSSAESFLVFLIIFGVYSVFLCELSMLLNVNVAKFAPAKNLPQTFSLNHTDSQLGLAYGHILGGFFAQIFGINGAFISTAILFLIFAMGLFFPEHHIQRMQGNSLDPHESISAQLAQAMDNSTCTTFIKKS